MAPRTSRCGIVEARSRLRTALEYLEVAELIMVEQSQGEFFNVAAGLAVLAGIAASDAICCARVKARHRGDDHREAADLLQGSVPDGKQLGSTLLRLLDVKDEAHYGVVIVASRKARDSIKWARRLTDRAREEVER